ncbi:lipoate--protein ligase family protein [Amphritea sp. HPY]|uniref:lipoate--protein ligase family protein n=1 Tax=Amphritea sp. HPY TaxID=3421652 RepID=UPI003D7CF265
MVEQLNSELPLRQGTMPQEQQVITDYLEKGVAKPSFLLWQYQTPAIIMGCSQRPDEEQLHRAEQAGLPIMRRGSGGGAVLAGPWMLSFTVFIPTGHQVAELNLIEIFGWLEQIWIAALESVGVACKGVDKPLIDYSKQVSKQHEIDWACYAALSHGEVVSLDNRKLVGLAQIRKRKGIALVSGLHLSSCDWSLLSHVVVNRPEQGGILESLNCDAEQLSGISGVELLPAVIDAFIAALPDDFELILK